MWIVNTSRRGQQYLERYMSEELTDNVGGDSDND